MRTVLGRAVSVGRQPDKHGSKKRQRVPCESDEHVFRPEAYDLPAGDPALDAECCTVCGWSWNEISDHDRGDCCCPASHVIRSLRTVRIRRQTR